jgi:hypothetical protein
MENKPNIKLDTSEDIPRTVPRNGSGTISNKIATFRYSVQDASIPNTYSSNNLTHSYRWVTVDWILEVHRQFKFSSDTYFLAVNYFDRLLTSPDFIVDRQNVVLTMCACSFLASKIRETYSPEAGDYVFISNKTFTERMLLDCEKKILIALGGNVMQPTIMDFIRQYLDKIHINSDYSPDTTTSIRKFSELLGMLAMISVEFCIPLDGSPLNQTLTFASRKTICHPSSVAVGCCRAATLLLKVAGTSFIDTDLLENEISLLADLVIASARKALIKPRPYKLYFEGFQNAVQNTVQNTVQNSSRDDSSRDDSSGG